MCCCCGDDLSLVPLPPVDFIRISAVFILLFLISASLLL